LAADELSAERKEGELLPLIKMIDADGRKEASGHRSA
jgi:hypothetical protein